MYAVLDNGGIHKVMSLKLAKKMKLEVILTARRIIMADGASGNWDGIVSNVSVRLGDMVVRVRFMIMNKVPFKVIIGERPK